MLCASKGFPVGESSVKQVEKWDLDCIAYQYPAVRPERIPGKSIRLG